LTLDFYVCSLIVAYVGPFIVPRSNRVDKDKLLDNRDKVTLNGLKIPRAEDAKYFDRRLNWKKHIFTERKQLGIQWSKMYWLLGSKSQPSIENELLLYEAINP